MTGVLNETTSRTAERFNSQRPRRPLRQTLQMSVSGLVPAERRHPFVANIPFAKCLGKLEKVALALNRSRSHIPKLGSAPTWLGIDVDPFK
jgi:hypothetical protein